MPQSCPPVAQQKHLGNILSELTKINREAEALVRDLSETQLNWIPQPGAWSIALCLEHLVVTSQQLRPFIENAVGRAKRRGADDIDHRRTWMGNWLISALEQRGGRKFKAPRKFQPPSQPAPGVLVRFLAEQRQISSLVERSSGVNINKTLRSPATPLMRYNIGDAFQIIVSHASRHLHQAAQVRGAAGFPA